jgi:hypothetical protein
MIELSAKSCEPVAKVGYFYDGLRTFGSLAVSQAKPYETCIFDKLLLQN